jgi:FixJ family two-component response regulator
VTGRPTLPHTIASAEEPVVFVIDDDASVREALSSLFRSVGLRVEVSVRLTSFCRAASECGVA